MAAFTHSFSKCNISSSISKIAGTKIGKAKKNKIDNNTSFVFHKMSSNKDVVIDDIISKTMSSQIHAHHHVAIKTRNIENAIMFYSLFGFHVETKFRSGPARAAWLITNTTDEQSNTRLELIEVPAYILQEDEGTRQRAIDLMKESHVSLLGLNHFALDVTEFVQSKFPEPTITTTTTTTTTTTSSSNSISSSNLAIEYHLDKFIQYLNESSQTLFGKTLRVALQPQKQRIGNHVYELAFLYDADGSLLELLYQTNTMQGSNLEVGNNDMESGWIPWDGKGFQVG